MKSIDYKTWVSLFAVALVLVGYYPYIIDIIKKKTKPHIFTWLVWTFAVGMSALIQIVGGAGVGAWTTVVTTIICCVVLLLSFKYGSKDITGADVVFLILAFLSLCLWVIAKQPVWSVILVVATDLLGFIPTIRKSWKNPYSETLFTYEITALRHGLSIIALQQFNILTLLYPIAWTLANLFFSVLLIVRRKSLVKIN